MSPLLSTPGARRRGAGAGVACLLGALAATLASAEVGHQVAAAATTGTLDVHPRTGTSDETADVAFTTSAPCPGDATNFVIKVAGPNVPEAGVNAVGFNDIPTVGGAISGYALGASWDQQLSAQAMALPLNGTYTLTLMCLKEGTVTGDFTTTVKFTPKPGGGTASTFEAGEPSGGTPTPTAAATATATPTPTGSATPTPSTSATPSPSPAASTTPTPSSSATASPSPSTSASPTPAPTPTAMPSATVTPAGTVTPAALPATGSSASRPLLAMAALLLVVGALLIVLSVPADPGARDS